MITHEIAKWTWRVATYNTYKGIPNESSTCKQGMHLWKVPKQLPTSYPQVVSQGGPKSN